MRHEGTHPARGGKRQRLTVTAFTALGVEPIGVSRDITEQMESLSREPGMGRRKLDRSIAEAAGIVEAAKEEARAAQ